MKRNFYVSTVMGLLFAGSMTANAESVIYKADDYTSLSGTERVEVLSENLTVYHDVANGNAVTLGEAEQTFPEGTFTKYFYLPKSHITTVGSEANAIGIKVAGDYTLQIGGIGGAAKEKNIAVWYVKNDKAAYISKAIITATKDLPFSGIVSCKTGAKADAPVEIFVGVIGGSAGLHYIKVIPFMTPDLKSSVVTTDVEEVQNIEVTGGYFVNNPGVDIYYRWIQPSAEADTDAERVRSSVENEGYTLYDKNSVPTFDPTTTASAIFEYYATDGIDSGEVKQVTFTAKEGVTGITDITITGNDEDERAFDILGRPVSGNYRGIVIKKGKKEYRY